VSANHRDTLAAFCPRPEAIGTYRDGASIDVETLLRQAALIAQRLPPPAAGSEVAFAFENDRATFAASLLGTWAAGHTAALPVDATRDNIAPLLDRKENVAFLHDTGVGRGIHVPPLLATTPLEALPASVESPDEQMALASFAPGSDRPALQWSHDQLAREVDSRIAQLELGAGMKVVCSISPTQLEAVVSGLLAPLRAGARFLALTPREPEELRAELVEGCVLVTSHAHEQRLLAGGDVPATVRATVHIDRTNSIERALLNIGGVEDAAFLSLDHAAPDGSMGIAAVVAPEGLKEPGEALAAATPAGKRYALHNFDRIPRTLDGSLISEQVLLHAGWGRTGRGAQRTLEWTEIPAIDGDSTRRFRTSLPDRYAFFEGHFPTYPVLASAVQLNELILPCVRRVHPDPFRVTKLQNLKFIDRIQPGDPLEIAIRATSSGYSFEILRDGRRCSMGKLLLKEGDA